MDTQKVFRAGNSNVVAIPKHIFDDLGLKTGQKVFVERTDDVILIKKVKKIPKTITKNGKSKISAEFQKWLDTFMKENGEILDELAVR